MSEKAQFLDATGRLWRKGANREVVDSSGDRWRLREGRVEWFFDTWITWPHYDDSALERVVREAILALHGPEPVAPVPQAEPKGAVGGSEGRKDDAEKNRVDLLPFDALEEVAKVLTFGARKYADRNWERGMDWMRVFGGVMRHMWAWVRGEDRDPESGLLHLAHATCDTLFLLAYALRTVGIDNRPTPLHPPQS